MALRALALALVFLAGYAIPHLEGLLAWEPGIPETQQIVLMNLAYQEGYEHGMALCQPKLPEGPKIRRKGGKL